MSAYLSAWARVRRIVAGRHGTGPVRRYTTLEAVEADFGRYSREYLEVRSLWPVLG